MASCHVERIKSRLSIPSGEFHNRSIFSKVIICKKGEVKKIGGKYRNF